ncbi:MAG: SWIM zinc finger family protein [Aggregatilineales bacterium]
MSYKITLEQIRARTNNQSFGRGQTYHRDGLIFDPIQRGDEIEAQCEASSQPEPYRVWAKLAANGIAETSCTCLYEYGGDCKHIVALLLTYLNAPDRFDQRTPVADALAKRSKDELIALIHKMLKRAPDLQALVDLPAPGKTTRRKPVDTTAFHKELRRAFRAEPEWGDVTAAHTLQSVADTANEFAESGDWRGASAIYQTAVEETAEILDYQLPDDEGEFGDIVNTIVDRLSECLDQPELANNDDERRAILNALLSVYIWDSNMGGIGIGDMAEGYILRGVRQPDLSEIRQRIIAEQGRHKQREYGGWAVQGYAEFLVQLDTLDNIDPEVTLARLRDEGMYDLLVGKLLELRRTDEAVAVVEEFLDAPYERLMELPRLVAAGRADDAVRLAEATLQSEYHEQLAGWLIEQYKASGNREAVLRLLRQHMTMRPSEPTYAELKGAAEALGQWTKMRPVVVAELEKNDHLGVLTQIYLRDSEWDAAWATLAKFKQPKPSPSTFGMLINGPWGYVALELEVVKRSASARPHLAIPVLIRHIRAEIDQRGREHYRTAVEYLLTVRDLYRQISDEAAYRKLVAELRTEFKQLRALQDEMTKAKL